VIDYLAPFRARLKLGELAGRSIALANVLQKAELAATSDTPILITGGGPACGKTTLARIIHDNSARREQPFVQVDCAAIPSSLSERRLGGSADVVDGYASETTGAVDAAHAGTLYLREVSGLSRSGQSALLRVLLTREFSPVGSPSKRSADVRIIASSTGDPLQDVARGRLSEELFLLLNMMAIVVPPLADRRDDIVPLAQYLCSRVQQSLGMKTFLALSPDALDALEAFDWPGNVRQLASVVQAGAIQASVAGAQWIEATHIPLSPMRPPTRPRPLAE
jgi:DNA-binding NtrC family response regulator